MTSNPICRGHEAETLAFPWGQVAWSASARMGNSASMTFGRATMRPGQQPTRHRHPNCDEILHVIAGEIEHSLGDELFILQAGDTISIPTGVWHGARALGETTAELVICFSSADRQTEFES